MRVKESDKAKKKQKKGLWSPDEDQKLRNYIFKHGHHCWSSVPTNAGLQRNGKSCRLRWINYLRPGLKRGAFSLQEEDTILSFHKILGNKWSQIAHHLPGRTDNEIKNHWQRNGYRQKSLKLKFELKMNSRSKGNPTMNLLKTRIGDRSVERSSHVAKSFIFGVVVSRPVSEQRS